jgi:hypothetical protein
MRASVVTGVLLATVLLLLSGIPVHAGQSEVTLRVVIPEHHLVRLDR